MDNVWHLALLSLALLLAQAPLPAYAQADDVAAERARLAYERIEAEAKAREQQMREGRVQSPQPAATAPAAARPPSAAREPSLAASPVPNNERPAAPRPQARTEAAAGASPGSGAGAVSSLPASRSTVPPAGSVRPGAGSEDLSRALEQLRTAGELKDAGYITQEEFERIKARILDSQF